MADKKLDKDDQGIKIFTKGIYKAHIKVPSKFNEFIFGECSCDKLIDENQHPQFLIVVEEKN